MKLSVGKRILMFFHWLLSLLICVGTALYVLFPDLILSVGEHLKGSLGPGGLKIAGIVLLAVYIALAALQLYMLLPRKKRGEKGFIIVESGDNGRVRIAISAVEQMVRQSVKSIEGISEMKIGIDSNDDAVLIDVKAVLINGNHVPSITANMQRSIRQFVELNCGVAVQAISISIDSVTNQAEPLGRRLGRKLGGTGRKLASKRAKASDEAVVGFEPAQGEAEEPADGLEPAPWAEAATAVQEAAREEIVFEPADAPEATPAAEPEPYDFDKPYESDFAKDLAAMRARESAGEKRVDQ